MQTIQELANRFYPEQDHSSITYNKRLCEQVRELIEYHVNEALKEALESIPCLGSSTDIASYEEVEHEVLNSYPLTNIK
jgi:hypothetical protein